MSMWDRVKPSTDTVPAEEAGTEQRVDGWLTRRTLIVALIGAAVLALSLAVWQVSQILLLIFAAILVAIFLRTLAEWVSRHSALSMGWSLAAVVLALLGAFALIGALYGPAIVDGFYQLVRRMPTALARFKTAADHYAWGPDLVDALSRLGNGLADPQQLAKVAGVFSTALGALGSVLVVAVLGIYLAAQPGLYIDGTLRLFPPRHRERVGEAFQRIGHALRWWLLGRIAAMSAVGVATGIGLAILGMPFVFILSLLNAVLDFIPNIGPLVAAVPAVLVGLSQDGATAFYVALLYFAVQSLEGFLLMPLIQQRTVAMAPALMFAAQLFMGAGFGILGLLLAPPLAVVVMVLVRIFYLRDTLGERIEPL
ncbi:AI-2E family transporter [Methylomagnum ishizawai]|uniref:AI-2E family transporter n=1 Tax=Methylomagnum ishizawai TaxID=1760988 RepID=UPI001C80D32C|nr:AI-2E family transporter [Methylomagnum ishizawai]